MDWPTYRGSILWGWNVAYMTCISEKCCWHFQVSQQTHWKDRTENPTLIGLIPMSLPVLLFDDNGLLWRTEGKGMKQWFSSLSISHSHIPSLPLRAE